MREVHRWASWVSVDDDLLSAAAFPMRRRAAAEATGAITFAAVCAAVRAEISRAVKQPLANQLAQGPVAVGAITSGAGAAPTAAHCSLTHTLYRQRAASVDLVLD